MRLLLNNKILCNASETSLTTCICALFVDQGIPARTYATLNSVMLMGSVLFLFTRYSCWSSFLVIKGITFNLFLADVGVSGMPRAVQKSSANRPERYPCLVSGVDSDPIVEILVLPLS